MINLKKTCRNVMHAQYVPILKSIAQESFGVRWVPVEFVFFKWKIMWIMKLMLMRNEPFFTSSIIRDKVKCEKNGYI